jgi:glycosyltransferase involved in cell wall biosynthesis
MRRYAGRMRGARTPPAGEALADAPSEVLILVLCTGRERRWEATLSCLGEVAAQTRVVLVGLSVEDGDLTGPFAQSLGDSSASSPFAVRAPAGELLAAVNELLDASRADVVFLRAGALPGPQWLSRMRRAAHSDSTIVSASALSGEAADLTVARSPFQTSPGRERRADPRAAAESVAALATRSYPRIRRPVGPAVYLRHEALDLVGPLVVDQDDLDGALAQLADRALSRGMLHVAADDVFMSRVDGIERADGLGADEEPGALRRCLATAQVAVDGLSVTIDARALGPATGGTQVYILELVLALSRLDDLHLRVVVPPDLSPQAADALATARAIDVVGYDEAARGSLARSHVVHRPQQVFSVDDVALLRLLGERIVIGQQDLIAYRNPAYHPCVEQWHAHRRVTRLALALADRVVFFSEHALSDAVDEDLIDAERAVGSGIGGERRWTRTPARAERPAAVSEDAPFVLCLGADYMHKNRPFAVVLTAALRELGCSDLLLVLAGPHVEYGSSREQERAQMASHPELDGAVIDLGAVSEAARAWLMAHARAIVYPSTYEGYGLLPSEAAEAGIPCLFAAQAALAEGFATAATIVPWDAHASARAALPLLSDGPPRDRHIALLREAVAASSWSGIAQRLREAYVEAVATPHRTSASRAWQELERERHLREVNEQLRDLRDNVGALAGPAHGGLLTEAQRRGLLRAAPRPVLRRVLLAPAALLGRRC